MSVVRLWVVLPVGWGWGFPLVYECCKMVVVLPVGWG